MSEYQVDFQILNGVLHVQLSGTFPNELLHKGENAFQPLIDACAEYGCKKALIDARDLQVDFDTLDLFEIGGDTAILTRAGLQVALLAREDMLDSFFQDVAYNRGSLVRVFTDKNTASEWLEKP